MATTTFDIGPSGENEQFSSSIPISSLARVRFTDFTGGATAWFEVAANGVTTLEPITDTSVSYAQSYGPVNVRIKVNLNRSQYARVAGILEDV
jgi:hypothetical protein